MNSNERVIFRIEKNPYFDGASYLAVFPDTESNPGRLACVPFHSVNGTAVFEPFGECSLSYYYETKRVRRRSSEARQCLDAVQEYYKASFHVVEKMISGLRQPLSV